MMADPTREDWGGLRDAWMRPGTTPTPATDLRRRVVRHGRWMLVLAAIEVLLTIGGIVGVAFALRQARDPATLVLCGGMALFTARIWIFTLRNRRGTWRAHAETVEAFRALERTRRERRLDSARFAVRLCGAMILGLAAWWGWQESAGRLVMEGRLVLAVAIAYLCCWIAGGVLVAARTRAWLAANRDPDDLEDPATRS